MRVNYSEIPSSSANFMGGQNEANGMPVQKKKGWTRDGENRISQQSFRDPF